MVAYWSLQNLGVGNRALVRAAESRWRSSNYEMVRVLDQVRDEVAQAYARTLARFQQISTSQKAVVHAQEAFQEDLNRIRAREGLPIEVLDSLRLLGQGRSDYLNAIVDYNSAEFELYVAMGQPTASMLEHRKPVEPVEEAPLPAPLPPKP